MPDEYPPYSLKIKAFDNVGNDKVMSGTHAGTLVTSDPVVTIEFELTHGDAENVPPGQIPPNLILTLRRKVSP